MSLVFFSLTRSPSGAPVSSHHWKTRCHYVISGCSVMKQPLCLQNAKSCDSGGWLSSVSNRLMWLNPEKRQNDFERFWSANGATSCRNPEGMWDFFFFFLSGDPFFKFDLNSFPSCVCNVRSLGGKKRSFARIIFSEFLHFLCVWKNVSTQKWKKKKKK